MIATPEFDSALHRTAIAQLDAVAARLHLDPNIHERLRYPRRALVVSIPVMMDSGRTEVFIGYRVERRHHERGGAWWRPGAAREGARGT